MSIDSAQAFLETWYRGDLPQIIRSTDTEERLFAVAKESGFDFTREEWMQVAAPPRRELSEAELGEVSGGVDPGFVLQIHLPAHTHYCNDPGPDLDEFGNFDMSRCADHAWQQCHRQQCVGYNGDHSHPAGH